MFNEETWKMGEQLAQEYMKKNGYKIVYTNFAMRGFELDIVATLSKKARLKKIKKELKLKIKNEKTPKEKMLLKNNFKNTKKTICDLLVITEVKSRADDRFGKGCECIDLKKRSHLIHGAKFLMKKPEFKNMQVRFDIASVDAGKINYIENSFCA